MATQDTVEAIELDVRFAARGVPEARLRTIVDEGLRRSPVDAALVRPALLERRVTVREA